MSAQAADGNARLRSMLRFGLPPSHNHTDPVVHYLEGEDIICLSPQIAGKINAIMAEHRLYPSQSR